jgi:hypothetical protein
MEYIEYEVYGVLMLTGKDFGKTKYIRKRMFINGTKINQESINYYRINELLLLNDLKALF